MKILLIAPSSGYWKALGKKKLFNGKTFRFSMLSLLTIAALTPEEHEITLIDEQIDTIPENPDFDLVGITVMTAIAPRAYELCEYFHKFNIPVIVGGFHPTFNIEEALSHADTVVVGPATGAWSEFLIDFERGHMKQIYHGDPTLPSPAMLPKQLLNKKKYITVNTMHATLGCRNACSFCSITAFYKEQRYQRPVEEVVEVLKSFKEKFFMFIDDNLTQDRDYIMALLKAMIPLKKKWVTQASIEIADDPVLLQLMHDSGCMGVFAGLESFSESALCSQNKRIKPPQYYKEAVKKIHDNGIYIEAGLIFGFDNDGPKIFEDTLKLLDDIGIDVIQASILTPLPGTALFKEMKDTIMDFNWEHYDYKYAVYEPAQMTREELRAGLEWINKRFYSPWRILKRLVRWILIPNGYRNFYAPLYLNMAYWGRQFQFKVKGYNPARRRKKTAKDKPRWKKGQGWSIAG